MTSTTLAYTVPFTLDRSRAPRVYRLVNDSAEAVTGVRVTLVGSGLLVPVATTRLEPGDFVDLCVLGVELARNGIAVVRWFRPGGDEYLWRFSF
ncbi:hypothetical protein [Frigoribacterium sp. PhB24]|uniref:hypothetical protein n=1 Tax=Frigoribacterium sp. PhB24 TaxID=2485204 RepID=UPI000F48891F|nr:hypothetical protein [Frigoribacterium sp. PhB24]ROS51601.1 hypothetical protein EDF50_1921 [Frigoribacterium sp. PhB24]